MLLRVLHVQELGCHFNVRPFGASASNTIPVWTIDFFGKHDKTVFLKGIKVLVRPHLWNSAKFGLVDHVGKRQFVCFDKNLSNVFLDPILVRVPLAPFTVERARRFGCELWIECRMRLFETNDDIFQTYQSILKISTARCSCPNFFLIS
jgi:hypothetical protein